MVSMSKIVASENAEWLVT